MNFFNLLFVLALFYIQSIQSFDSSLTTTGNVLYTPNSSSVSINSADYWLFNGCPIARNGQSVASLIITIPGDSPGEVAVEVNCDPYDWTNPPYSNYLVSSSGVVTTSLNVTFSWNDCSGDNRYVRVTGEKSSALYTLQMVFDDSIPLFSGDFDMSVFNNPNPNPTYNYVYQYSSAYGVQQVQYKNYAYFGAGFCPLDVADLNGNWKVVVTVIADPSYPDSGFNVVICGNNLYQQYSSCVINNVNIPKQYISAAGLSVNNIVLTNLQPNNYYNLTQFFVIGIYGTNLGSNYFSLYCTYFQ